MKKLSAYISTFIYCFIFWLLLVPSMEIKELLIGAIAAIIVSAMTAHLFIHSEPFYLLNPVRLVMFAFFYIVIYFWELLKANIAMTKIVLSRNPEIKQGIVRIPAKSVHSEYGRQLVANCITMTPGTLTLDVAKDEDGNDFYYVQWIDVAEPDREKAGEIIKGRMEKWIRRIWR